MLLKQNKNNQEGNNYSWKQARESEKQKLATAATTTATATATAAGEKEEETDCSWRSKDKKRKMTRWVFSVYRLQRNKDVLELKNPPHQKGRVPSLSREKERTTLDEARSDSRVVSDKYRLQSLVDTRKGLGMKECFCLHDDEEQEQEQE